MDSATVQNGQQREADAITTFIDECQKQLQHLSNRIQLVKGHVTKLSAEVEADTSNTVNGQRQKDILNDIQNNWPTMEQNIVILGKQQTEIARLIKTAMTEQLRQDNDVKRRCRINEQTLVVEIDELTREKEHFQKQISTLKRSNILQEEQMRFSVEYLEAEVTKREKLIHVLNERLRKSSETARYFDQCDESNFDEYRQKMQRWQQDDIELLRKSEEIKKEFVLKHGRLLINTLLWAFTAIVNLPDDCIHKPDCIQFLNSLRVEVANIKKEVLLGHDHSVKETIQQIKEYINQRPGNCSHANEFKDMATTLQKAIRGDYTGIQRDISFTEGEVTRTSQKQKSKTCTLL